MDFWSTIRNCFCKSELNLLCCWEQKVHFGNWDDWSLVRHQYWLCEFSFSDPPGNWFPQPELQDYRSTVLQRVFVSPFTWWTWIKRGNSKSQPSIITLGAILCSDLENFLALWHNPCGCGLLRAPTKCIGFLASRIWADELAGLLCK